MGVAFFTGIVAFGVSYILHVALVNVYRRRKLHKAAFLPLWAISWTGIGGIVIPALASLYELVSGAGYGGVIFLGGLIIAFGALYSIRDLLHYDDIQPFLRDSLFMRHSSRSRDSIFAAMEQREIDRHVVTDADKEVVRDMVRTRKPVDRDKELKELAGLRSRRRADVGKDELELLHAGTPAEITDVCKLHHVDMVPHPTFERMFRLTVDPQTHICRSCVVFDQRTSEHVKEPKRWFRFRQDLFDHAEAMFLQDWMERFKPYYTMFEIECYQEETDSFGLPRTVAFLRVGLPVRILEKFKDRIFIATELENVSTVTWLEGEQL